MMRKAMEMLTAAQSCYIECAQPNEKTTLLVNSAFKEAFDEPVNFRHGHAFVMLKCGMLYEMLDYCHVTGLLHSGYPYE